MWSLRSWRFCCSSCVQELLQKKQSVNAPMMTPSWRAALISFLKAELCLPRWRLRSRRLNSHRSRDGTLRSPRSSSTFFDALAGGSQNRMVFDVSAPGRVVSSSRWTVWSRTGWGSFGSGHVDATSFCSARAQLTESNRKRTRTSSLSSRYDVGVATDTSLLLSISRLPAAPGDEMASMLVNVQTLTSSRSNSFSARQLPLTSRQENTRESTADDEGVSTSITSSAFTDAGADGNLLPPRWRRDPLNDSLCEIAASGPVSNGDECSSDPSTTIRIVVGLVAPLLTSNCDLCRICQYTRQKYHLYSVLSINWLPAVLCTDWITLLNNNI